jgi:hypothetical protein
MNWKKLRGSGSKRLGLDLSWTEERLRQIETGHADPDRFELRQWRVASCRRAAEGGEAWIAWLTPMRDDAQEVEASGYSMC